MIFSSLIIIGASLLAALVSFLPTSAGLSAHAISQIESLATSVNVFSELIAIDVLWDCIIIIFTYELILLGFNIIRWFVRLTPLIGNRA